MSIKLGSQNELTGYGLARYTVIGNNMRKIDLQSVVWKEGKYFIAQCLEVDVSSFGKTKKEALSMLHDALSLYFEDMPIPRKTVVQKPCLTSIQLEHA